MHRRSPALLVAAWLILSLFALPRPSGGVTCLGDCSGDGVVSIDELLRGVQRALGVRATTPCPAYDGLEPVTIAHLVSSVALALDGCAAGATPTGTPTATLAPPLPSPTASESATPSPTPDVVGRVFDAVCAPDQHWRQIESAADRYWLRCELPGHWSEIGLRAYDSVAQAAAAFSQAAAPGDVFEFHDLPGAYWEVPFYIPSLGGADRYLVWRLGCWVISAHSFDDTTYRLAPQVVPVSEALLTGAGDFLRARCRARTPTPVAAVDLVPSGVRTSYSGGSGCGPFGSLHVCVTNAGTLASPAFAVSVEPGVAVEFAPLVPDEERCASQPLPDRVSFFTVRVDPDDRVAERNEANNLLATGVQRPTVPRTCSPTATPTATRFPTRSPTITRTPTPTHTGTRTRKPTLTATVTRTMTPTPSCAATGTPYCANECVPCPTVRLGCYRSACGRCFENPHCAVGEVLLRGGGGTCGSCVTPTPTPISTRTPPSVAPDLVVGDIRAVRIPGADCRGPFAGVRVCVVNRGTIDAGPFAVWIDPGEDIDLPGLAAGTEYCATGTLYGTSSTVAVRIDLDNRIDELDEDNNAADQFVRQPTLPATCATPPTPPPPGG